MIKSNTASCSSFSPRARYLPRERSTQAYRFIQVDLDVHTTHVISSASSTLLGPKTAAMARRYAGQALDRQVLAASLQGDDRLAIGVIG